MGINDNSPPNIGAGRPKLESFSGVCGVCACDFSAAAAASLALRNPNENTATDRTRLTSAAFARERAGNI